MNSRNRHRHGQHHKAPQEHGQYALGQADGCGAAAIRIVPPNDRPEAKPQHDSPGAKSADDAAQPCCGSGMLPKCADSGEAAIPLSSLAAGQCGRLHCINSGQGLRGRLTSMGLAPGSVIEVVRRQGGRTMVVQALRTRLALGHGISEKIMVLPLSSNS